MTLFSTIEQTLLRIKRAIYDRAVYHKLWGTLNSVTKSGAIGIISNAYMMTKAPEEGRIWEWRAFGIIDDTLAAKVRAHPIRQGISDIRGEDLYLIAPHSDQNVKLRRVANAWVLKLKLLFETNAQPFELYNESAEFSYYFPVALDRLRDSARLLAVTLPATALSVERFDESEFVKALSASSPPVTESRVYKMRSQYQFENGWLELADVKFASRQTQSLSIHSPDLEVVEEMVESLAPGVGMEPMNYVEACRRWG